MHGSTCTIDVRDAKVVMFKSGIPNIPIHRIPILQTDSRFGKICERITVDLGFGRAAAYSIVTCLKTDSGVFEYIIAVFVRAIVAAALMHCFVDQRDLRATAIQRKAIELHTIDSIKYKHRGSVRIALPFQDRIRRAFSDDALSSTVCVAIS